MPIRTAAVERILQRAIAVAKRRGGETIEPIDLFVAILGDESRGAELLAQFQVHIDDLETATLACDLIEVTEDDPFTPTPLESAAYSEVLQAGQFQAALAGRAAEFGSEHLVLGLAEIDSPIRDLLVERGATTAALQRLSSEDADKPGGAIPTDFVLDTEVSVFDRQYLVRAVDAAANRASEGLRVAEDYTRFVLNDGHLTKRLKQIRHGIVEGLRDVPLRERLAARDTRGDVGTVITSPSAEGGRTEESLLAANLHRAEEALRSLEEFGRLIDPRLGPVFEGLRYELYTIEKACGTAIRSGERFAGRNLYVLVTVAQCALPVEQLVERAADGGAGIFQVREKGMQDRALLAHLRILRRLTREKDALLIVNDRPDLAVLCDADGVHVGQEELTVQECRRIVGPNRFVGVSTHTIEQARAAVLDGADYLGVGPVFASKTKSFEAFAGLEFVQQVAEEIALPWYAIGGIDESNIGRVCEAGGTRVAVSSAVCGSDDPRSIAAAIRRSLKTEETREL